MIKETSERTISVRSKKKIVENATNLQKLISMRYVTCNLKSVAFPLVTAFY